MKTIHITAQTQIIAYRIILKHLLQETQYIYIILYYIMEPPAQNASGFFIYTKYI